MWRGMSAGLLAALPCAWVGIHLYLRRMSLLSDALAHVALPGIVIAFMLSDSLAAPVMALGALGSGLLTGTLVEALERRRVRSDAAVGVVFTSMFALGVVLLSVFVRSAHIDTQCVLFGNILGVSDGSLRLLGASALLVAATLLVLHRVFTATSFDAQAAPVLGLNVRRVRLLLSCLAALVATAGFEAVGSVLIVALLVLPAATAHRVASTMRGMFAVATAVAALSTVVGMYLGAWLDVSPTGAIVLSGAAMYLATFVPRTRSPNLRHAAPQAG
jgi:ABC-type Mn2+/Zn2+ transport system permease subunit